MFVDSDNDDDTGSDSEENEDSETESKDYLIEDFWADLEKMKKKTKAERQIISTLKAYKTLESIRTKFLPKYLECFVADEKSGWRKKFGKNADYIPIVLRFFAAENRFTAADETCPFEEFVQQLSPLPKISARYTGITSTILAWIFCSYLKKLMAVTPKTEQPAILKYLKDECMLF